MALAFRRKKLAKLFHVCSEGYLGALRDIAGPKRSRLSRVAEWSRRQALIATIGRSGVRFQVEGASFWHAFCLFLRLQSGSGTWAPSGISPACAIGSCCPPTAQYFLLPCSAVAVRKRSPPNSTEPCTCGFRG